MAATLDDAWAKVEWAYQQLIRLNEALKPFLNPDSYLVRDEVDPEGTERVISAELIKSAGPEIPFIFGDLIHALHSSLDYVVCSLVESVGEPITTHHAFPMFGDRATYEARAPEMLRHVPDQAAEFIKSVQPYHYAEWAAGQDFTVEQIAAAVETMPLMRLYRLSVEEKHRALLLASSLMDIERTHVSHNRVGQEADGIGFRVSPAHDKVQIIIKVDPTNPDEQFGKGFGTKVTLAKGGPWDMPIEDLARMLYREVAHRVLAPMLRLNLLPLSQPRELPFPL